MSAVQLTLDDPRPRSPATRATDPETSWKAEDGINKDGTRDRQARQVLALVRAAPGKTSAEIGQISMAVDRYIAARRLPELEKLHLVRRGEARRCSTTGRQAMTWWPL